LHSPVYAVPSHVLHVPILLFLFKGDFLLKVGPT
jgi:hypothetical protein